MTIITPIACIALVLILCVSVGFITGAFGRIGSPKASFQAAGLIFIFMTIAVILILIAG